MNKFLEEKEKLLNSIENNTPKHWKEYYKDVPIDCIFEDLVIDINEIKRLTKENQQLKEQLQQKEDIINKISKKCSKEKGRTDFDIFIQLNEQLKTLERFAKKIDYNLHPIITEAYKCAIRNSIEDLCKTLRYDVVYKDSIKEILDNKGDEK